MVLGVIEGGSKMEIEQDLEFGCFIGRIRRVMGVSLEAAAQITKIPYSRFVELEEGNPIKSVTRKECQQIANAFGLALDTVIKAAIGKLEES